MPFPFRYICDLLQHLDDESRKETKQVPAKVIIETWFREHRTHLNAQDNDACAILSTLLPERRTDRVYCIQTSRLESIFGKALLLGASRVQELRRYRTPALGVDLADCIEGILSRTPNPDLGGNELTVEEIDNTLSCIAAACRFSSPSVRASRGSQNVRDQDRSLTNIYRQLSPRDAKWFTRLVLKNYQPVVMDDRSIFRCYHVLLPQMIKVRDDLTMATAFLRHIRQSPHDQTAIANLLKPSIGTKVGRQTWFKGRSIKHCLDMGRSRDMSCEQKIDGEYCQIHIDLRKPSSLIQIFSKSGKDSTQDRASLHGVIRDSLKLGTSDCPLKTGCILEGELVVYSTKENKILPFHKIRKHVSRSGSFIGTNHDSQPHDYEHLMIIYYDVLMIDNESLLAVRQSERFRRLSELITCRKGYAELVQREIISFSRPSAASKLREAFAKCIVARSEGLVLKSDEPYFDFSTAQKPFSCCNIKLKKEYVQGWGDVGDFAVVGASYDAAKAREYKKSNIRWTHFFIGCMDNKEKARVRIEKPRFIITNIVELPVALLSTLLTHCFPSPVPFERNDAIILDFRQREMEKRPTEVFTEPLVFDMRCFSFDKAPNTTFWSMRFPSVSKIHHDRTYWDTISFTELQEIALNATEMPEVEDSQEMRQWISALENADPKGIAVDAMTQESTSTEARASPLPPLKTRQVGETWENSAVEPTNVVQPRGLPLGSCVGRIESAQVPINPRESSAVDTSQDCALRGPPRKSPVNLSCRKRLAPDTVITAKKPRKLSDTSCVQTHPTGRITSVPSSPVRNRSALGQIDANSQSQSQSQSQTYKGLPTGISKSESALSSSGTDCGYPSSPPEGQNTPKQNTVSRCCSLVGNKCALSNYSILLAPCIAQYAWITENLLRDHGINDFLVEPQSWTQSPSSKDSTLKWDPSSQKMKKVRIRKICLVESRRQDATLSFYEKIEAAALKKKNGDREWVGVYDWRILEDISDIEAGRAKPGDMDPWRKRYVGIT
ncbi:hypothetical protein F4776DRAFT_626350 [Hypoxylon sp. NC0597]|nr:hypothetical protein F4776DRAFT_626350 [Hypoxylon sp. NC0597]